MGSSATTFAGTMLAAICLMLAGPASAFEPMQPGSAEPDPHALSFPVFLDHDRLPQLQAAWDSYEDTSHEAPSIEPVADAGQHGQQPASDVSLTATRGAMGRAAQASQNAAVVRRRAEELSRRFGADETPGVVAVAASVETEPAEQQPKKVIVRSLEQSAGVATSTPAQREAVTPAADALIETANVEPLEMGTKLRLAAPLPRVPPMPLRRTAPPAYDPPPEPEVKAVPRTRPSRASRTVRVRTRAADGNGNSFSSFLPTQLRAFGWNTQPD